MLGRARGLDSYTIHVQVVYLLYATLVYAYGLIQVLAELETSIFDRNHAWCHGCVWRNRSYVVWEFEVIVNINPQ